MGISYSNDARQFALTLHSGQETQQAIHHVMIHDPFFSHVIHHHVIHHVIHPTGFSTIPFGSSYYF
ncbi:hypothetical protein ABH963_003667 [Bacillus sp. RC55]|uniref:Uncharacterized protein n=1 Tax=Bacillus mycoides TaxID=1405 RepID=A0A3D9TKF7_BACMY|nr:MULTISPECIES: hypothetical protein [Bacillus]MBK5490972.1 hypothetical protein [Bacillus sp. TH17]MBK5503308.1 hypothetical protein [Bacillus sp. TH12]QWG64480.1 hypothetical protein EXW60_27510 [Bacillus mycoides]QWG93162.1 hypothetical protein EXW40_29615 [Bacillus mycoides]QWJ09231.1 hypothetical protein J5V76_28350 [Bacillus mycoides]